MTICSCLRRYIWPFDILHFWNIIHNGIFLQVLFGINFLFKLGLAFFAIVIYVMVSLYLGMHLVPRGNAPKTIIRLSTSKSKAMGVLHINYRSFFLRGSLTFLPMLHWDIKARTWKFCTLLSKNLWIRKTISFFFGI
jgi:hypothetical protein